ncbi:MAG: hypothetical protein EPO25_09480 [Gammaproteobacteria bacterium]|nr:MAG: hypothetical protein EPO25_09480 [Gammaproteobacteria bacterium]
MSAALSHCSPAIGSAAARVYRRRRPERTALYRLVQQHLETWLARRRERDADGAPIPRHVERELRGFLECGILACGFAKLMFGCRGPVAGNSVARITAHWPRSLPVRDQHTRTRALPLTEMGVWTSYPSRARDLPDPETAWAGTPAFSFDQSPPWDPLLPAPDPGLCFDQTRN